MTRGAVHLRVQRRVLAPAGGQAGARKLGRFHPLQRGWMNRMEPVEGTGNRVGWEIGNLQGRGGPGPPLPLDSWGHSDELNPLRRRFLDCGMLFRIRSLGKCLVKYLLSISDLLSLPREEGKVSSSLPPPLSWDGPSPSASPGPPDTRLCWGRGGLRADKGSAGGLEVPPCRSMGSGTVSASGAMGTGLAWWVCLPGTWWALGPQQSSDWPGSLRPISCGCSQVFLTRPWRWVALVSSRAAGALTGRRSLGEDVNPWALFLLSCLLGSRCESGSCECGMGRWGSGAGLGRCPAKVEETDCPLQDGPVVSWAVVSLA